MQINRTPTARIDMIIASRTARVMDRLLTKHRGKVNRVADPDENGRLRSYSIAWLCRGRTACAKRTQFDPGRGRSGQADSNFAGAAHRLDGGKSRRIERRRWRIQDHECPPRLSQRRSG